MAHAPMQVLFTNLGACAPTPTRLTSVMHLPGPSQWTATLVTGQSSMVERRFRSPPHGFMLLTLVLATGALLVGFFKVGFGQGAGIVTVPLYSLLLPIRLANGLIAPLLVLGDLASLRAYWRRWDTRALLRFLPGQLTGVLLGTYALAHLSEFAARKTIGAFLVALVLVQMGALRRQPQGEARAPALVPALGVSLVSGFVSALAQIGSAPLSLYLVLLRTSKNTFVPTMNLTFFFSNVLKLAGYWHYGLLNVAVLRTDAWLAPAALAGAALGLAAQRRIPQRAFEYVVLVFALAAGITLLAW